MTVIHPRRPVILLFGDSLTEQGFGLAATGQRSCSGWASRLAAAYTRRADVWNRGYFGYNTNHALTEILPSILAHDCKDAADNMLFATIFFGANDAVLPGNKQHVPLARYQQNVSHMITQIRYVP
eukprot:scaffold43448_cov199-Amphora_coffeaeformis.AAC.4